MVRDINVFIREMAKDPVASAQVDAKNKAGLVQPLDVLVDATAFTAAHKQKLLTLVQSQQNSNNDDKYADVGAPAASIYKTRKAEVNAKHNFGMLKQSLEDQLKFEEKKVALEHDLGKLITKN